MQVHKFRIMLYVESNKSISTTERYELANTFQLNIETFTDSSVYLEGNFSSLISDKHKLAEYIADSVRAIVYPSCICRITIVQPPYEEFVSETFVFRT